MFDSSAYVHVPVCELAVCNDEYFNSFKSDRSFTTILEHTSEEFSRSFLSRAIVEYKDKINLIDWDKVSENDSVGTPILLEYPEIPCNNKLFSPSTIAYVFKALEILQHMKDSSLNNLDVLEIGGGYGGQCKMVIDLAPLFDININSYTLIDLYWPNELQRKYLENLGYTDKIKYFSYEELRDDDVKIPPFNYLISIYALGEFMPEVQQFYVDKMVSFPYHYLVWNTPQIHERFLLSDIEEERPRTGPFNVLIKSKVKE